MRLDEPLEVVVGVPAGAKALRLAHLNYFLVSSRAAQCVNVDPRDSTEQFPNLSVCLLVPLFVTFAGKRAPEGAIRPVQVLLDGAGPHREDRRICVPKQLLLRQHRVVPIELQNHLVLFGW